MPWTILEYCKYSLQDIIEVLSKIESSKKVFKFPIEILLQSNFTTIDTITAVSKNGKLPSFAHGDIKPGNIMFKIDAKSKKIICHLIDFGTSGPDDSPRGPSKNYGCSIPYVAPNRFKLKNKDDLDGVVFEEEDPDYMANQEQHDLECGELSRQ